MIKIKALANTDNATWPDEFVKVYLKNYLVRKMKTVFIKLDSEVIVIKVQDSSKDIKSNTCSISIPDNIGLSQTDKLPAN